MNESRLVESAIGLAGRLSHIPYGVDKAEDGGWWSSRNFTQNAPAFRVLGVPKTWIPPEPDQVADSQPLPGTVWGESRRQQNWLVKHHPEASLGNLTLHDDLVEADSPFPSQRRHDRHTCFFSLGELTDTSLRKNTGVPLAVTVTGSANNILRLVKLDPGKWAWPQELNVAACLTEMASEKPTLWIEEDVGPIRCVKCIVDLKSYNPTRWLAVQRESGTTIFQPEYRKVSGNDSLQKDASRIAANPIFSLTNEQTGGNTHTDVSFNPGARSNRPQLAVIDERGFWSIWDVKHAKLKTSSKPIPTLRICGHIDRGVLEQFPYRDRSALRWHKILWVGRSEDNLDLPGNLDLYAGNEDLSSQTAFPTLQRSSSVLVCNSQQLKVLDLITGVYLPDLKFRHDDSLDCLLDVQIAHDPQYFYVLTTSKLFVARLYSTPGMEWDKPGKVWTILFSTPHYRCSFDRKLKLAITQGVKPVQKTSFVFMYSSTNPWLDLFYFEFSPTDPNRVRCQANVTGLGNLQNAFLNSAIQTLYISPTPIIVKSPETLTKIGHGLVEKRIRLYQIMALRSDMSLASAICVSSLSPSIQISVPTKNVGRRSRAKSQKDGGFRGLSSEFIINDSLATPEDESPSATHRYMKAFYERLSSISARLDQDSPSNSTQTSVSRYNPFNAAHQYIEEAVDDELLPDCTLLQIMPNFEEASGYSLFNIEWKNEIWKLNNIHPSVVVYTLNLLNSRVYSSISGSLQEAHSRLLRIANSSLHYGDSNDANEARMVSLSEQIVYESYLSQYRIGYRKPNFNQLRATVEEGVLSDVDTEALPDSRLRSESSPPSMQLQRLNSEAVGDEDPAMILLRAYTGTGNFVPATKSKLLDKWKLGAEPSDYIFDLDRGDDIDAGEARRQKELAREDRKRRRAQTLIHLSQEPELRASQPAPDTSFYSSQPKGLSSPSQVIHSDPLYMMSQPTAGAFGKRPNKKAKKRLSGFK